MAESQTFPCDVHSTEIERLQKDTEDQWAHINGIESALRKLVPVWVTAVMTLMGTLTGSALTVAVMMVKFAGK